MKKVIKRTLWLTVPLALIIWSFGYDSYNYEREYIESHGCTQERAVYKRINDNLSVFVGCVIGGSNDGDRANFTIRYSERKFINETNIDGIIVYKDKEV